MDALQKAAAELRRLAASGVDEEVMALEAAIGGAADSVRYLARVHHLPRYDSVRAAAAELRLLLRGLLKEREAELDGSAAEGRHDAAAEARAGE